MRSARIVGGVVVALALAGCGSAQPDGQVAAPGPAENPSPVRIDSACDVFTPEQVRNVLGDGPVAESGSSLGSADFQSCMYQVGGVFLFDTAVTRGMTGDDGQQAAESLVAAEGGDAEPVAGLAQGAAYASTGAAKGTLAMAYPAGGGELVLVSIRGDLSRDQLVELARVADANL